MTDSPLRRAERELEGGGVGDLAPVEEHVALHVLGHAVDEELLHIDVLRREVVRLDCQRALGEGNEVKAARSSRTAPRDGGW